MQRAHDETLKQHLKDIAKKDVELARLNAEYDTIVKTLDDKEQGIFH